VSARTFVHRSRIDASAAEVFAWHARPGALERLTPPWDRVEVVERTGGIQDGDRVVLRVGPRPFRRLWVAEHADYQEGRSFRDIQVEGPFRRWEHTHTVVPDGVGACFLIDQIVFEPPLGAVSGPLAGPVVERLLRRSFAYRHRTIAQDLAMHRAAPGEAPMNVLVTGSSGLIGSALTAALTTGGHRVTRLVRSGADPAERRFAWDPAGGSIDPAALEGVDAVVHLAGESVAGRWTEAKKDRILSSRVGSTGLLAEALAGLDRRPQVLVCASAIGYYGDSGDEPVAEDAPAGNGFLADVVKQWEAAAEPAVDAGIRVVNLRFGIVLSPAGGALKAMLPAFRLGVAGRIGEGSQQMSWVAIDDVVGAVNHAIATSSLSGPVNATAPSPVTNAEFTRTLGRVLHRPTILPLPAFAARAALGEFATELLTGARVIPRRLTESGYEFRYPELEGALRHVLGK
jgi:hypothetical protein